MTDDQLCERFDRYRNHTEEKRTAVKAMMDQTSPIEMIQNLAYAIAEEGIAQGLSEEELQDIRTQYQQQYVWAFNSILRANNLCAK